MKVRAAVLNAAGAKPKYVDSKPLSIETLDLERPGVGGGPYPDRCSRFVPF